MQTVGIVIQARMGSTRLPGKVLLPLPSEAASPLSMIIHRLEQAKSVQKIIVATSTRREDSVIADFARDRCIRSFRGDATDVLSRYYWTMKRENLDVVVRIPADKPCVDPELLDHIVETHISGDNVFTTNTITATFPVGLEVEVVSSYALEEAFKNASTPYDREHVTPFVYRKYSEHGTNIFCEDSKLARSDIRLTLDTSEDYALVCTVIDALGQDFRHADIVRLFEEKPWLLEINRKVRQKRETHSLLEELSEAAAILKRQECYRASKLIERAMLNSHNDV